MTEQNRTVTTVDSSTGEVVDETSACERWALGCCYICREAHEPFPASHVCHFCGNRFCQKHWLLHLAIWAEWDAQIQTRKGK